MIEEKGTITQEFLDLMLSQFRNSQKFRYLATILASKIQELDTEIINYAKKSVITKAQGWFLDRWGDLLKEPRSGLSDEDYRKRLFTKAILNTGSGSPEEIIALVRFHSDPGVSVKIIEFFPAGFNVEVIGGVANIQLLLSSLKRAKSAGVRLGYVSSSTPPPSNVFSFSGSGDGAGFSDTSQTIGGKLAGGYA
jgi:hypothetical protein